MKHCFIVLLLSLLLSGCSLFKDTIDTSSLPSDVAVTVESEETSSIEVEDTADNVILPQFDLPTDEGLVQSEEDDEKNTETSFDAESASAELESLENMLLYDVEQESDPEEIRTIIEEAEQEYKMYFPMPSNPITEEFIEANSEGLLDDIVNGVSNLTNIVNDFVSEKKYDIIEYQIEIDKSTEGAIIVIGTTRQGETRHLVVTDTKYVGGKKVMFYYKLY